MPSTDLPLPGRRINARTRLRPPVEARLALAREQVQGWIVDQQDDGLGMRFGHVDADRLMDSTELWREGPLTLSLPGLKGEDHHLPVRLVHVTQRSPEGHECLVGLMYDRKRMRGDQVRDLLQAWVRFSSAQPESRPTKSV